MKLTVGTVAENFGRDLEENYTTIAKLIEDARAKGVRLLALPEAAIGGYLSALGNHGDKKLAADSLPPALSLDGPEVRRVIDMAGDMVVCIGFCEADGETRYNTAVALDGSGILGHYRKVHQPLGENMSYAAGSSYQAFDTPVGRLGLQICYDKAFPEAARSLALDGAEIIVSLSAWPTSRTATAENIDDDRWTKRYNLFDQARGLENQVFFIASNQAGTFGSLRYAANAKVVDPGGNIIATTGPVAGLAVATIDVAAALATTRKHMFHLRDRRPDAYSPEIVSAREVLHA